MFKKKSKVINNEQHKTTGMYKIAASIIKKVKSGKSYKTQLYEAQYPVKLLLYYHYKTNYLSNEYIFSSLTKLI